MSPEQLSSTHFSRRGSTMSSLRVQLLLHQLLRQRLHCYIDDDDPVNKVFQDDGDRERGGALTPASGRSSSQRRTEGPIDDGLLATRMSPGRRKRRRRRCRRQRKGQNNTTASSSRPISTRPLSTKKSIDKKRELTRSHSGGSESRKRETSATPSRTWPTAETRRGHEPGRRREHRGPTSMVGKC